MHKDNKNRLRSTILGTLVADAASVGFHWLYDQERIREIAPDSPEFHPPTMSDYDNVPGFYAHGSKRVGDLSQYGEQALVLMRSLVANGGRYDKTQYENAFREHFGYGGKYVGYIDHPTRDTLDNITRAENAALKRAKAIPFEGDDNTQHMMITKVLANIKQAKGEELRQKVEEAVRQTNDDDSMVAYAMNIVSELEKLSGHHGADDEQLPAISKLPALVSVYAENGMLHDVVESAVRVTNDNDLAVLFGHVTASIIEAAIHNGDPLTAIANGRKNADPIVIELIDEVLSVKNETTTAVTSQFGMSCHLAYGFPSVIHNLISSGSYREAIQKNIYAGGDSCGRAVFLGAVLGATNGIGGETGIPLEWIENLTQRQEVNELLDALFDS
ncbi:ADP-ribosylglycohydrolase family protein [Vibrio sp. VB16]|uniref:ADP-ribosylglycohydrolase family protein n=1 Tax=Vibrio sp. VB16 TaxID=2785746 RepID=UPI0018A06E99|nr:ADP-ribosylglycohydrolase family protein [Vibrio sp. VB16]UGA54072.1 ADP-ribosylglycohydrolase family protein [Vibrio sp. VB16]